MKHFSYAGFRQKRQFRALTGVTPDVSQTMIERLRPHWRERIVAAKYYSCVLWLHLHMEAEDICLGWCELVVGSEYDGVLGWRAELAGLQERLGELFGRAAARRQANLYLEGLLSAVERKNGWQLAEQIGAARSWRTIRGCSKTIPRPNCPTRKAKRNR